MYSTHFLDLPPLRAAGGSVTLPGSKSISNRVLLLAALSAGETTLHDLLDSDDTRVMLAALETLGCGIERLGGHSVRVRGLAGALPVKSADLFLGNAGTAMRPLTAALALLAAQQGDKFELRGIARMHERPIGDLVDGLRQRDARAQVEGEGHRGQLLGIAAEVRNVELVKLLGPDRLDRDRHVLEAFRALLRGDDNFFQTAAIGFCTHRLRCRILRECAR